MKHLKILGMAVVAAAALMAFVGASSASADVLCTTNTTNACASGWRVTEIVATQVGTGTLKDTSGNTLDTCSGAEMKGKDTEGSATHEPGGEVSSITWSGCTTTTVTKKAGRVRIETNEPKAGAHTNTVVSTEGTVTIELFGVNCEYTTGAGTSLGDLTIGEPATLHINAVVTKDFGGLLCPNDGRWEATFQVTNHKGLWMSKE